MTWRSLQSEEGVTAVEATLGISLLLFVALFAIQLVLFFHGTLAARAAALNGARDVALTGDPNAGRPAYLRQQSTALGSLRWPGIVCQFRTTEATCEARVQIPSIVPAGGALFGSGGVLGPITVTESAQYPALDTGG
ncbi:MAG TPA: hypothetical protein VD969_20005 [Symbiobacteriaceae bacterium]|nr:hypothetical protein [Symbiobacteriaceae bacterium]